MIKEARDGCGQAVSTWPDSTLEVDCNSGRYRRVYRDGLIEMEGKRKKMRYTLSVAQHVLAGKLTIRHAIYALRVRPVAVSSKGQTWIIDPNFKV